MVDRDREPIQSVRAIDRIGFFSDAVFAIAMTLLVLQLRLPLTTTEATLAHDLAELGHQYVSFVLSFLVISMFWRSHHRRFDALRAYDDRLVGLNTLLLLSIVFLPSPRRSSVASGDELPRSSTRSACWWRVPCRSSTLGTSSARAS